MKSELSEAERTPLTDEELATKFTGSCTSQANTDDVAGKLRAEIATSILEADSKRDELHGALKSALETQDCRLGNVVGRLSWKRTRGQAQGGASGPAESKGGI